MDPTANQAVFNNDDEMEEVRCALEEEDVISQWLQNAQSRTKAEQLVVRSESRYVRLPYLPDLRMAAQSVCATRTLIIHHTSEV